MKKVLNIVLTGGPCAGKSSSLEIIKQYFNKCGYKTYVVLESATELINSGLTPLYLGINNFQEIILKYQLYKEDLIRTLVNNVKENAVIIYDRGLLDNKAYIEEKDFNRLLYKYNINEVELYNRYDLVICLETGAKSKFYTLDNNKARYENSNEAIKIDDKIFNVWSKHFNLKRVKCYDNFEKKQDKIIEICENFKLNLV